VEEAGELQCRTTEEMTHIRTVRDLIVELNHHLLDLEVVVVSSPTESYPILGVLEKNGRVFIDPSAAEEDKEAGFISD
jgi:hypothetical protein